MAGALTERPAGGLVEAPQVLLARRRFETSRARRVEDAFRVEA